MTAKVEHSNAASAFIDRIKSSLPGGGVSDVEPKGSSSSTPSSGSNASAGGGGRGSHSTGGGSSASGGSSSEEDWIHKGGRLASAVCAVIVAVGVFYWYTHDTPPNRAATEVAFNAHKAQEEITAQSKEETKRKRLELEIAKLKGSSVSPVVMTASEAKRDMVIRCGRKLQEAIYKPDPGCFYFDNSDVSSNKTIQLWSRTSVVQIIPEHEDRPGVAITAANGSTCVSNATESCTTFIRSHSSRDGEFVKFTAVVPGNQGLIAQFNVN